VAPGHSGQHLCDLAPWTTDVGKFLDHLSTVHSDIQYPSHHEDGERWPPSLLRHQQLWPFSWSHCTPRPISHLLDWFTNLYGQPLTDHTLPTHSEHVCYSWTALPYEEAGTTFLHGTSGITQPTTLHHILDDLNPQADLCISNVH
jgi:hypothetical protein